VAEQATGFGDVHWTNPGNITGEDGAFASVSLLAGAASLPGRYSFALYASNFGFDIPDNAEILHIRLLSTARNGGAEQETGYAALALVDSDGSTGELNLDGFFLAESLQTDEFVGAGGDPLWGGQWSPQQ